MVREPGEEESSRERGAEPVIVLHVDDEAGFATMTAEFLERRVERLSVETATSAAEGLERLAEGGVDCVVSDYDMPGKNGVAFLRAVREEYGSLPFVLFTGKGSEEVASEAISAGVTDYLQKEGGTDQYAVLANRIENVVRQHRAERELERREREVEERTRTLQSVVEASPNAVVTLDDRGMVDSWDADAERLFGWAEASVLGRPLPTVPADERDAFESLCRRVLDGERVADVETAWQTEAGARLDVRLSCAPVRGAGGDTTGLVVVVEQRDVAERTSATGALDAPTGERQEAFDALAEASADGIIMLDDDSDIQYANPAVERILGYTREELVGSSKMKIIPERLRQVHATALKRFLQTGEKHIDWTYVELPGLHRDGHEVPLAISLNDFEYDGEHYFVGTFRDISQRKEVERRLERQNERLEEFASIVSHDLQSPLTVVRGYLELFQEEYGDDRTSAALSGVGRIESIVEDTLSLARQGQVVDPEAMERVALADVAEQSWQAVETDDATLELDTPPLIRADADRLRHVLENLFRNATEHGGSAVTVRVGALPDGSGFYVEDTGRGIPEDERESVFDAGYTTASGGTGFGLSIVGRVAEAHGWHVTLAESDAGGARFEFTGVDTAE